MNKTSFAFSLYPARRRDLISKIWTLGPGNTTSGFVGSGNFKIGKSLLLVELGGVPGYSIASDQRLDQRGDRSTPEVQLIIRDRYASVVLALDVEAPLAARFLRLVVTRDTRHPIGGSPGTPTSPEHTTTPFAVSRIRSTSFRLAPPFDRLVCLSSVPNVVLRRSRSTHPGRAPRALMYDLMPVSRVHRVERRGK